MLSQVKRKQKILLALTLAVLITGSILAFSIQAAYSTEELFGAYNFLLSRSNTQTSIEQVQEELKGIQDDARIEGDETLTISIDNMVIKLDEAKKGVDEMTEYFSAVNTELQSLKQTLTSTASEPAVESIPQTTESTTKESARITTTPERIDIAKGLSVFNGNAIAIDSAYLFHDSWVIVVSKPILGDTISDELKEYFKVTLSDARIASIVENERTTSNKSLTLDQFELTKSGSIAPGPQPEDIKPIVPEWVRNNAGWYAEGLIPEGDFVRGLEWMINNGVIQLEAAGGSEDAYQK